MIAQAAGHVRSVNARFVKSTAEASGRAPSRRTFVGALALLAGVSLSGCGLRRYAWLQKLTVTVQTPAGETSGAAVSQIGATVGRMPMTGIDLQLNMSGEATVVALPSGKYLFALLGEQVKDLAFEACRGLLPGGDLNQTYDTLSNMRVRVVLPPKLYPLLVTFDDLKVPASVKQVDPDNLAAAFGEGYALTSIALEIVDEPVTRGEVEKILPWILSQEGSLKPAELRLGTRVIYEAEVLPIEKIQAINFVWWIK